MFKRIIDTAIATGEEVVTKGYSVSVPIQGRREYPDFSSYFLDIIRFSITLASALAVLFILFGAFKYITSGTDTSKDASRVKDAKDTIVGALVGLALLLLIRLIIPLLDLESF